MKALASLIFIGALIGLAFLISRGEPSQIASDSDSQSSSQEESPATDQADQSPTDQPAESPAQGGSAPTGKIFALTKSLTQSEIYRIDVVTKEKNLIFSDKNDEEKLQLVANVTRDGSALVGLLTKNGEPMGRLAIISTDGKAKITTLLDNFTTSEKPVISPDQKKLAMVSFSNADPNFGFTLSIMNIDGSGKKDLLTDESGISRLAFSPDGKQIAAIKGSAADSNAIVTVDVATGKSTNLYTAKDRIIEDFDWSPVGLLAVTTAPRGKRASNQSEVFAYDPKAGKSTQITKNDKAESSPKIAPDAAGVSFIESHPNKVGNIIVTYHDGSQPVTIGSASELLGWIK